MSVPLMMMMMMMMMMTVMKTSILTMLAALLTYENFPVNGKIGLIFFLMFNKIVDETC